MSIHPEGKRYVYNTAEDGISVVTEAHVTDPGVVWQSLRHLPPRKMPTFRRARTYSSKSTRTRKPVAIGSLTTPTGTVFWLHTLDTDAVGLPESHAKRHLRESYAVFNSTAGLNWFGQRTCWRRITGPMWKCSLPLHRNMPRLP